MSLLLQELLQFLEARQAYSFLLLENQPTCYKFLTKSTHCCSV